MVNKEMYIHESLIRALPIDMMPWWMDAVSRGKHWEGLVAERGGRVVGLMAMHWTEKWGVRLAATPLLSPMTSVWTDVAGLGDDEACRLAESVVSEFVADIRALGIDLLQIKTGLGLSPDAFLAAGLHLSERYTYAIPDISDPSNLLPLYHPMKRRYVNKAAKAGYVFSVNSLSPGDYYDAYQGVVARRGQHVMYDKEYFVSLADTAVSHASAAIFSLALEGVPAESSMFCVWDAERAYAIAYWTLPEAKNSGSSSLMFHRAVEHVSHLVRVFDFEGGFEDSVGTSYSKFATQKQRYFMAQRSFSLKGWVLSVVLRLKRTCWTIKK